MTPTTVHTPQILTTGNMSDFQLVRFPWAWESQIGFLGFNGIHGKVGGIYGAEHGQMVCVEADVCWFGCAVDL